MLHRFSHIILGIVLFLGTMPCFAAKTNSSAEARKLFDKVYNLVFGPEGSTLHYKVNLIGIYKTEGTIIYKGKKLKYEEKRFCSWNNGSVSYDVDKDKKTVSLFSSDNPNKDKYLSKFKYNPDDYTYSVKAVGDKYEITAHLKHAKFFGVRSMTAVADKQTLYPTALKVKVAILSATVEISNFHPGGISDDVFNFPSSRFKSYKFKDCR